MLFLVLRELIKQNFAMYALNLHAINNCWGQNRGAVSTNPQNSHGVSIAPDRWPCVPSCASPRTQQTPNRHLDKDNK